jgi:hypothetical protein
MPIRVLAIDWSGAKERAGQKIWLAEAAAGTLSRVENGRDRHGILDHLLDESRRSGRLIVGLDFAFSLPSWFLAQRQVVDGPGLWTQVTSSAEEWLAACPPPFWGRPRKPCPRDSCQFRRTEQDVGVTAGIRPKSVFQIGGAGAVGTESLRGMPILLRLRDAGFAVWPFDDVHLPLVVEIYPRLLTRAVNKSRRDSRATSFDELRRQHVKLVKFRGPFVWHRHENEDELFLVHKGPLHDGASGSDRAGRGRGVHHRPAKHRASAHG